MISDAVTAADVVFGIAVFGALGGLWFRIENAINKAKTEALTQASAAAALAQLAQSQLAEHKLHVAETYITKQGMRETRDEIMGGVRGLNERLDQMNQRMDMIVHERQANKTPRPRSQG